MRSNQKSDRISICLGQYDFINPFDRINWAYATTRQNALGYYSPK